MFKTIHITLSQRAVLLKHDLPVRALAPGKHRVWGAGYAVRRFDVDTLTFSAPAELRAMLPGDWFAEITLGPRERGVLYMDGRPVRLLRPGVHRYWTVDPTVHLEVLSVDEPVPEMTDELYAVLPRDEIVDLTVLEYQRGLLYVQGRFVRVLEPGRHAFWSHRGARATVGVLDMRRQHLTIAGQELMTRDKVTLRLTLTVEHRPLDPRTAPLAIANTEAAIYLLAQLAAREFVAGVTLDELLEGRDAMTRYLEERCVPEAATIGIGIERIGVKDIVLPGDMKLLLNRVIEAEKQAAANVILRREDAAATRSMANAARVMAEEPTLLRLKELETLEKVAARIGELKVVLGAEGLGHLLGAPRAND